MMKINMIYAQDLNSVIGDGEKLLWHIPEDLAYFKELTINEPIIMGRKTFESLPNLLPNRKHIVITNKNLNNDKIITVDNFDEAVEIGRNLRNERVWIIGGASVYSQALDRDGLVNRIYRTIVDLNVDTVTPVFAPIVENYKIISDSNWLESKNGIRWKKQIFKAT